jgi:Myb-like DNA-binding domain
MESNYGITGESQESNNFIYSFTDTVCTADSLESSQVVIKFQKNTENSCKKCSNNDVNQDLDLDDAGQNLKNFNKKKKLKRWTAEEDQNLLELFYNLGNDWKEIASKLPGRAPSGVKNRFYWICKSCLPSQTVQKIKTTYIVKKMYKAPIKSELFRKINSYIKEECILESFLALDNPSPYSDLVYKLKMSHQDLENHLKIQILLEKAQQLYISCENAKQNLACLQKNIKNPL